MEIIARLNITIFLILSISSIGVGTLYIYSQYPETYIPDAINEGQVVVKNEDGDLFNLDKINLQKAIDDGFTLVSNREIHLYDEKQKEINNENKKEVIFTGIGIPLLLILGYYFFICLIHYILKGQFYFLIPKKIIK